MRIACLFFFDQTSDLTWTLRQWRFIFFSRAAVQSDHVLWCESKRDETV